MFDDGCDACLGFRKLCLAMSAQSSAALIGRDRILELLLPALQPTHDLLELRQRVLE